MALPGIVRYNRIRHELSEWKKENNLTFKKNYFDKLNKDIFRRTKEDPLKHVIDNIDELALGVVQSYKEVGKPPTDLAEFELFIEGTAYYQLGLEWPEGVAAPANLTISSPLIMGYSKPASEIDYNEDFKNFVGWVDANRDDEGDSPSYMFKNLGVTEGVSEYEIPLVKLIMGEFDWETMSYKAELVITHWNGRHIDDENNPVTFGYTPGDEIRHLDPSEWINQPVFYPPGVPEVKPPKEAPPPAVIDKEIELEKVKVEREKQTTEKLRQYNIAEERLYDRYKEKLITKKQYQDSLANLTQALAL